MAVVVPIVKIDGNISLVLAAFSFMACVVSFEAYLSTAVGDDVVAMVSAIVLAAGIPTVAYCAGLMLARGGWFTVAIFWVSLMSFHAIAFDSFSGFRASLSYSMLALGAILLGHFAGGPDDRFHVVSPVVACLSSAAVRSAGSDLASGMCFFSVTILAGLLRLVDLTPPRPGSLHAYFAGLYSPAPPAQQPPPLRRSGLKKVKTTVKAEGIADEIVLTTVKAEENADI